MKSVMVILQGRLWCTVLVIVAGFSHGNSWPLQGQDYSEAAACRQPVANNGWYGLQGRSSVVDLLRTTGAPHDSRIEVTVHCDAGFEALPSSSAIRSRCQNGTWVPAWPVCERPMTPCQVPRRRPNVVEFIDGSEIHDVSEYEGATLPDGTLLVARCTDPGKYRLIGDSSRVCTGGTWTGQETTCELAPTYLRFLGVPRVIASNGTIFIYPRPPAASDRWQYISCAVRDDSGLHGSPRISAPHIPDVNIVDSSYRPFWQLWRRVVTIQTIRLNPTHPSHSGQFTCGTSRLEEPSHTVEVFVKEVTCSPPAAPVNGNFVDRDRPWIRGHYTIAKKISFICDPGYELVGASLVTCTVAGWSKPTPRCIATHCPELSIPEHGRMIGVWGGGRSVGDERVFQCHSGYELRGTTDNLICQEGGVWSAQVPTCQPRRRQTPVVQRPSLCTRGDECRSWEKCVITGPETYECNCINPFNCRSLGPQVCGTDGLNYTSECRLKALACMLNTGVEVAEDGDICVHGLSTAEESPQSDNQQGYSEYIPSPYGNLTSLGIDPQNASESPSQIDGAASFASTGSSFSSID